MHRDAMDRVCNEHFTFEGMGAVDGILETVTDDIVHQLVGNPSGPNTGKDAVRRFYEVVFDDLEQEDVTPLGRLYGDGFIVDDVIWAGRTTGKLLGFDGPKRPVRFRMHHVFELRDGLIARETVWVDQAAIHQQLG
jgi:uncharacterized protein